MRVSVTARFLSHPTIHFGAVRRRAPRASLGLARPTTTYYSPRGEQGQSVGSLRSLTAGFRFPSVGGAARGHLRRPALPLGLQRARRG